MNCTMSCFKNNAVNVNSPSCEQNIEDNEDYDNEQKLQPDLSLGKEDADASVSGVGRLLFSVINFPANMKFKLKVNNKMLSKKWNDWTTAHQHVIFKRKIKEWRGVAEDTIRIVPEFTKEGNMHYNLVYKSKLTIKDIDITITDAYSVDHKSRKYFINTKLVTDLDGLNRYLKKEDQKQYQRTGIEWEIQNV